MTVKGSGESMEDIDRAFRAAMKKRGLNGGTPGCVLHAGVYSLDLDKVEYDHGSRLKDAQAKVRRAAREKRRAAGWRERC